MRAQRVETSAIGRHLLSARQSLDMADRQGGASRIGIEEEEGFAARAVVAPHFDAALLAHEAWLAKGEPELGWRESSKIGRLTGGRRRRQQHLGLLRQCGLLLVHGAGAKNGTQPKDGGQSFHVTPT